MPAELFTIGYCLYSLENFLLTLKSAGIDAVVDVRAQPDISHFREYRMAYIKAALTEAGFHYLSFAKELGARPEKADLYSPQGQVDFSRLVCDQQFIDGRIRLKNGLDKGFRICLMCAQKDPLNCHRGVLIAHEMRRKYPDIKIAHIWPDHNESQSELDKRAIREFRRKHYSGALLDSNAIGALSELERAYEFLGKKIAYSRS